MLPEVTTEYVLGLIQLRVGNATKAYEELEPGKPGKENPKGWAELDVGIGVGVVLSDLIVQAGFAEEGHVAEFIAEHVMNFPEEELPKDASPITRDFLGIMRFCVEKDDAFPQTVLNALEAEWQRDDSTRQ